MSCGHVEDVGAWVLGALPAPEAERFAAHLPGCAVCRREVAELQMVADTLPLVAEQVAPPPELKDRIMTAVRAEAAVREEADAVAVPAVAEEPPRPARPDRGRERPWWRRPLLALRPVPAAFAAAALIALGVAGGVLVSGDGGPSARTVQASVALPTDPAARAALTVAGERATLSVRDFPSPPSGRVYQVWLLRRGRTAPEPTDALFDVRGGRATVDVPGGVRGVDKVLVTDEPNGGSAAPTRDPVVIAQAA
jgi:anti-sigma factor RsiW